MDIFKIIVLSILCASSAVISWETSDHAPDCELVLVQVLYRHGDRNPIQPYPTDPYKNESFWPEGFGQLTKIGKMQEYKLGLYLRKRYDGYLSQGYSPYEIQVQSSNVDRTIMSADANLAGLYPPQDPRSRWNDDIKWQPIPVHNKPESIDNTLSLKAKCPRYQELYDDFLKNSDVMQKIHAENKELFEILTNHTGQKVKTVLDLDYIMDVLHIEKLYNKTLPEWTKEIFPKYEKRLEELCAFSFKMASYTMELQRLKGGPLLKELIANMKSRIDGSLDKRRKFFMYSAHDTTVATLLNTMDMFNDLSPPYSSMVMMELHRNISSNQYFVEILFRNSSEFEPYKLNIPGCSTACDISDFLELTASRVPDNWEKECRATILGFNSIGLLVAGSLLLIFLGLIVCIGLILRSYIKNRRSDQKTPKYPYLHLQMEDGDGDVYEDA